MKVSTPLTVAIVVVFSIATLSPEKSMDCTPARAVNVVGEATVANSKTSPIPTTGLDMCCSLCRQSRDYFRAFLPCRQRTLLGARCALPAATGHARTPCHLLNLCVLVLRTTARHRRNLTDPRATPLAGIQSPQRCSGLRETCVSPTKTSGSTDSFPSHTADDYGWGLPRRNISTKSPSSYPSTGCCASPLLPCLSPEAALPAALRDQG